MHPDNDEWMMKKIFHMSDHALIRMVNHLFGTEYEDGEYVQKEWKGTEGVRICLLIGCANRYEFQMRRFGKCLQIHAEDRGCLFYYEDAAKYPVLQLRNRAGRPLEKIQEKNTARSWNFREMNGSSCRFMISQSVTGLYGI